MKQYLNPGSETLRKHRAGIKEKQFLSESVYLENTRPKNATRIWVSYDIDDDRAPEKCRINLETWLKAQQAESFGNSIATFLIRGKCYNMNMKVAKWLINELMDANVLGDEDRMADEHDPFLRTPGLSLYIIYRSRNAGDGAAEKLYSGHFVLLQNTPIANEGGY